MGPFLEDKDDVNALADFGAGGPPEDPRPPRKKRSSSRPFTRGVNYVDDFIPSSMAGAMHSQAGHSAQGNHLAAAANNVMSAVGGEMQSRVAQAREMRRMEHEREMERMRQEALLKRLQAEQERAEKASQGRDGYRQVAPNAFIRHG